MRLFNIVIVFLFLSTEAFSVEVIDYYHRQVTLTAPAQRIVALSPHLVENVYSAGAGDLLVGAVSYSDYPVQAKNIPRVGSYIKTSLEALLVLKPDLVLLWGSGGGGYTVNMLQQLGLNVYVDDPRTLDDVARSINDIGVLAGTQIVSKKTVNSYTEKLKALRGKFENKTPVSVFYQIWNEPLQTLNNQHLVGDIMQLCGAENTFHDAATLAPIISMESVLTRNPHVIIASGTNNKRPKWLDDWRKWPHLSAVKNNQLYFITPDILQRHTTRILQGTELLCQYIERTRQSMKVMHE